MEENAGQLQPFGRNVGLLEGAGFRAAAKDKARQMCPLLHLWVIALRGWSLFQSILYTSHSNPAHLSFFCLLTSVFKAKTETLLVIVFPLTEYFPNRRPLAQVAVKESGHCVLL